MFNGLFVCLFFFLQLNLRHMEVPRLCAESELQLQPTPQPQQHQIWATSATYTSPWGKGRSLTHWGRPGIEPSSSQRLRRVLNPLCHNGNSNPIPNGNATVLVASYLFSHLKTPLHFQAIRATFKNRQKVTPYWKLFKVLPSYLKWNSISFPMSTRYPTLSIPFFTTFLSFSLLGISSLPAVPTTCTQSWDFYACSSSASFCYRYSFTPSL